MANYYHFCTHEVLGGVAVGTGDSHCGELRICISLPGKRVNKHLHADHQLDRWSALSSGCARELFELLENVSHLWEDDNAEP